MSFSYNAANVLAANQFLDSDDLQRHVTFSDHSESGYSTTTSSDEGKLSKSTFSTQSYDSRDLMSQKNVRNNNQRHFNDNQAAKTFGESVDPKDIDQFYRLYRKERNVNTELMAGASLTPSSLSPAYYDPLHLQNFPRLEKLNFSGNEAQFESGMKQPSPSERTYRLSDSPKVRGILRKNHLSKSDHNIYESVAIQENRNNPIQSAHHSAEQPFLYKSHGISPVRVPAFRPIDPNNSPSSSLFDPTRTSAFTPFTSKKNPADVEDLKGLAPQEFTPTKGPAVLDCVSSREVVDPRAAIRRDLNYQFQTNSQHSPMPTAQYLPPNAPNQLYKQSVEPHPAPQSTSAENNYSTDTNRLHISPPYPSPAPRHGSSGSKQSVSFLDNYKSGQESITSASHSSGSSTSQVEVLTNEILRLRHFLDTASAKQLKRYLVEKLESKDPKMIKALATLIPPTIAKQTELHCMRCHKSFNPSEKGRCYLSHPESMVVKINQDESGSDFICQCCNTAFRLLKMDFYEETTNALLTGHCYSGQHTTDSESVDFRPEGGAAKSCEENGCVEFYV